MHCLSVLPVLSCVYLTTDDDLTFSASIRVFFADFRTDLVIFGWFSACVNVGWIIRNSELGTQLLFENDLGFIFTCQCSMFTWVLSVVLLARIHM